MRNKTVLEKSRELWEERDKINEVLHEPQFIFSEKLSSKKANKEKESYVNRIKEIDKALSKLPSHREKAEGFLWAITDNELSEELNIEAFTYLLNRGYKKELKDKAEKILNKWKSEKKQFEKERGGKFYFWAPDDHEIDYLVDKMRFCDVLGEGGFGDIFKETTDNILGGMLSVSSNKSSLRLLAIDLEKFSRSKKWIELNKYLLLKIIKNILNYQEPKGFWLDGDKNIKNSLIESVFITGCFILVILRANLSDFKEAAKKGLEFLIDNQNSNGSWKDWRNEEDCLETTCIISQAICLSDKKSLTVLRKAEEWLMRKQTPLGSWEDKISQWLTAPYWTTMVLETLDLIENMKIK